jgi:chloramphenicol 3-O-phosphotransferase
VYELLEPAGAPKDQALTWTRARRTAAALADAFTAEGIGVVIVEGDFLLPSERAEFLDALQSPTEVVFVTLHVSFEVALERVAGDATRGLSRDPVFLRRHYDETAEAVRNCPATDLTLDTGLVGVEEAARSIAAWARPARTATARSSTPRRRTTRRTRG